MALLDTFALSHGLVHKFYQRAWYNIIGVSVSLITETWYACQYLLHVLLKFTLVNHIQDCLGGRATAVCLIVNDQLCVPVHYSNCARASSASLLHRFNEKTPLTENSSSSEVVYEQG